jgi:hypothetical protein
MVVSKLSKAGPAEAIPLINKRKKRRKPQITLSKETPPKNQGQLTNIYKNVT